MVRSKKATSSQQSQIRTIGDLEQYMLAHGLSPEAMARKIPLSNMTIRRMMRCNASERISKKYWPMFDLLISNSSETTNTHFLEVSTHLFSDFKSLTHDLELTGLEWHDMDQLKDDIRSKFEHETIGKSLKASVKVLLGIAGQSNSNLRSRAVAVGALLYFLNPVDLIPDALVGVGYLDDIAVASVAISAITNSSKATAREKKKLAR